jgi:hypothetical protein
MARAAKEKTTVVQWAYFPRSRACPDELRPVPEVFIKHHASINSALNTNKEDAKKSNDVLAIVAEDLQGLCQFEIELGKDKASKLTRPVRYGLNGAHEQWYDIDGWHAGLNAVLEVEAGAALANYKFLKALFEACVMDGVDYLVLAVPNWYYSNRTHDFDEVVKWLDTAYTSGRFTLPLTGILLVGY